MAKLIVNTGGAETVNIEGDDAAEVLEIFEGVTDIGRREAAQKRVEKSLDGVIAGLLTPSQFQDLVQEYDIRREPEPEDDGGITYVNTHANNTGSVQDSVDRGVGGE